MATRRSRRMRQRVRALEQGQGAVVSPQGFDFRKIRGNRLLNRAGFPWRKRFTQPDPRQLVMLPIVASPLAIAQREDIPGDRARAVRRGQWYPMIKGKRPQQALLIATDRTGKAPVLMHEAFMLQRKVRWQLAFERFTAMLRQHFEQTASCTDVLFRALSACPQNFWMGARQFFERTQFFCPMFDILASPLRAAFLRIVRAPCIS